MSSKKADAIVAEQEKAKVPAVRKGTQLTSEVHQRQIALMNSNDPFLHLLDNDRWEAINRGAKIIAGGICGRHLVGNNKDETYANALAISLFASNIGWMPNLLAPEAYIVKGKVTYSAKVIHALVKNHPDLVGSLDRIIEYRDQKTGKTIEGRGANEFLQMRVIGQLKGDKEPRFVDVRWIDGKKAGQTQHWDKDPVTQLWYMGIKIWARTWLPDASMGVYTRDEIEASDIQDYPEQATEDFSLALSDHTQDDIDPFDKDENENEDDSKDSDGIGGEEVDSPENPD